MKNLILVLTLILLSFCSYAQCTGQVRVFDMADPVDGSPWPLLTKEYVPNYQGAPVIFILPAIVGETQLDRQLALRFCKAGMATYILHTMRPIDRQREVEEFKIHDEAFLRAHGAVKNVIYELELRAQFLPRYGILGMSLGGVLASYVAGVERKILASTIIAGAGNTAGVLAHSDQRLVVRLRQRRMRALRIPTVTAYEAQLRAVLRIDPVDFASSISPRSMYLFIPNRDRTVPVRYQRELRDAVNAPLVYEMRASHTVGLVKATRLHGGKITSFFAKRLL
jgi:dienelactone hydrolase